MFVCLGWYTACNALCCDVSRFGLRDGRYGRGKKLEEQERSRNSTISMKRTSTVRVAVYNQETTFNKIRLHLASAWSPSWLPSGMASHFTLTGFFDSPEPGHHEVIGVGQGIPGAPVCLSLPRWPMQAAMLPSNWGNEARSHLEDLQSGLTAMLCACCHQ